MVALGMREVVGLLGLAAALLVSMSFCNPASGGGDPVAIRVPATVAENLPPTEEPSPTTVPPSDLPAPEQWFVRYLTSSQPGRGVEDSFGFVPELDIEYETSPYPGLTDDNWAVTAAGTWELPAGRYGFTIEHDGALRVTANGEEVRSQPDVDSPQNIRVIVEHPGGELEIALAALDTGGPFLLRWR